MNDEDFFWNELSGSWVGREFCGKASRYCWSTQRKITLGKSVDWGAMDSYTVEVLSRNGDGTLRCRSHFVLNTGDKVLYRDGFNLTQDYLEKEVKAVNLLRIR